MTQTVWHIDDLAQIGQTLCLIAPDPSFAAGVFAMCNSVGATFKLPVRREPTTLEIAIKTYGHQVKS